MRSGRAYTPRQLGSTEGSALSVLPHRASVMERMRGVQEYDPGRNDRQAVKCDFGEYGAGGGCF
jgi:hypothetical protein